PIVQDAQPGGMPAGGAGPLLAEIDRPARIVRGERRAAVSPYFIRKSLHCHAHEEAFLGPGPSGWLPCRECSGRRGLLLQFALLPVPLAEQPLIKCSTRFPAEMPVQLGSIRKSVALIAGPGRLVL